jgi:hypothetical protein
MKGRASQTSRTGSTCATEARAESVRTSTASKYARMDGEARPTTPGSPAAVSAAAPQLTYGQIAERAKALWLASGCLPGRDLQNWCEAEAQLKAGLPSD